MDKDKLYEKSKKIQLDRIGASCFFDAISCSLEFVDKLYWALEYTQYKFLYNRESFLSFENDYDLEKLLSKSDRYYFYKDPVSTYRNAISKYDISLLERRVKKMICFEEIENTFFFETIKALRDNKLPAVLVVNTLAYKEFYEMHNFTVPRSDCKHKINILGVSEDGKRAFIFDRGFDCFGEWIDIEKLYKGATSPFLDKNGFFSLFYFKPGLPPELEHAEIYELFKDNLENCFRKQIIIDDIEYMNNGNALLAFKHDLKDIIFSLESKYGNFAAALMGEALVQQVDGAMGLVGLYREMNNFFYSPHLNCLLPTFRHYWEVWKRFESRLQYITYNEKELHNYCSTLEKTVDFLIEDDKIIMDGVSKIVNFLTK